VAFRLHSRLVILNVVAISIVTLILGYFLSTSIRTTFESEIEDQLYKSATLARKYIQTRTDMRDPIDLAEDIAASLGARVTIIAHDGRVLGDSDLNREEIIRVENHSDRPEVIQALQTGRGSAIRYSATIGVPFIYLATVLDDGNILRVAMPISAVEILLAQLRRQLFLATLFSLAMTLVVGYMVYAFVSRPLHRMADASHQLAAGNLNWEIPVTGDRDLAVMGSSLNAMAKNLQRKMEELLDDKERIEGIISAMSSGVVVFDRAARVIRANQSSKELLGIHGDATGKIPMELVRHPAIGAAVNDALKGSDVPAIELTTSGGRVLLAKSAPVRAHGQIESVVMVFHDLTEIRRAEKMRKDFVANVSHEFKTPLTSIRGYAETLLTEMPNDPNVTREFLEAIQRNSQLLQALVDDLLVLARLESEPPVERQQFNIRELIEEQIQSRQQLLNNKNIRTEVECPPVDILADRARLARALSNLIDNAIQYNRDGGHIRISGRLTADNFVVDIADTGMGIQGDDLMRIFERFYRVEKSRTRGAGGTGLGLAIVKHAVESQGGSVFVSSKPGAGSTFSIFLPRQS
jgi:two-component system, OmpR family, phosphate regulon sensor histidine kinase PhoR